jgi:alanyl-tRNA synthetase
MIRLFDEDSYISEFSATVKNCIPCKEGYLILLSQTAFFPTAGGQECDSGTLDNEAVLSVILEDDEIYHIVKNPIAEGKMVRGMIYFEERFRKMQHHSAEHIVSGLAFSHFGLVNTGFHLGKDDVTIDYSTEITEKQLRELEVLANEVVFKNLEISASYPKEEELKNINYRSKKEILGKIRIVTIPDVDICACCAPHVKRTGEIGLIKFTDMMRHRGGVRIRMICGKDALLDYCQKQKNAEEISKMLSVPQNEVAEAVLKLLEQISEQKRKNAQLTHELALSEIKSIPKTEGNFIIFSAVCDKNAQRMIVNEAKKCVGGVFALLSGDDENGYSYIITANDNVSEYVKKLNGVLSGKGGGRGDTAEGHFSAKREKIESEFKGIL